MRFLTFIVTTIIQLYIIILLLRIWMQYINIDFYNPFSQMIIKITQPIVGPLYHFIPTFNMLDIATIIVVYLLTLMNIVFIMWTTDILMLININVLLISFIQILTYVSKLFFWLILIRSIFSWITQANNPLNYIIIHLTEPLISPIKKIIPNIGGIDFSSMIIMLIITTLNYLRINILIYIDPSITNALYINGYI